MREGPSENWGPFSCRARVIFVRTKPIENDQDVIDSRDVIARIEALQGTEDEGELKELAALEALAKEAEGYAPDWQHGEALIRDSYFESYMDEMLEDCGELPKDLPCYLSITVDYKALQMDYTSVEFDGVTYWIR